MEVDFSQFSFQSKLALNYYILEDVLPKVECIQVVGSDEQSMVDRDGTPVENKGDSTERPQNDPAVPAELAAAIGIMQYFAEIWNKSVFVPKETIEGKHDWSMLPQAGVVRGCLEQLERFCLMTRDYFTTIVLLKNTTLAPTFIKEFWSDGTRSEAGWKSKWKGKEEGIGALLEFSENMLDWFLEMDRNGLTVLSVDEYATILERKAERGQTSGIRLHGVKGSAILGVMNQQVPRYFESREHKETPNNPVSDAYALALMDACKPGYHARQITPYSRDWSKNMYWFTKDDPYARTCLDAISVDKDLAHNLKQIRDALSVDVERDAIDFSNLTSIPDIWATHRIFDMMLFLPPNIRRADPVLEQYRDAVVRQWRAILTVLLIGRSHYKLNIVETDFSVPQITAQAGGGARADKFMGTIVEARPQGFIWVLKRLRLTMIDRVYRVKDRSSLLRTLFPPHKHPSPTGFGTLFGKVRGSMPHGCARQTGFYRRKCMFRC